MEDFFGQQRSEIFPEHCEFSRAANEMLINENHLLNNITKMFTFYNPAMSKNPDLDLQHLWQRNVLRLLWSLIHEIVNWDIFPV